MRQKVSLLVSRVKTMVNIRNCTFAILIIVGLSIIFAIVIIMVPEPFQRLFPKARESIATLATAAMVFATLLLAYGTFNAIKKAEKQRKYDREEALRVEIRSWARNAIRLLTKPSQKGITPDERMAIIKINLHTIKADILTILSNAAVLGNDLEEKTKAATTSFLKLDKAVENLDKSVLTDRFMARLLQKFNGIIKSTTRI